MPLQYLHTSAKRGLEPGKSGFCCVARDRELPVDLARELERLSRYEHISGKSNPIILRHLQISIRSGSYHILSRLRDAGNDYSKRNNHIAHHLAFTQDEAVSLPDPATILLFWNGWKDAWIEPPRVLGNRDNFEIEDLNTSSDSIKPTFDSLVVEGEATPHVFQIAEGQEYDLAIHYRNELLKLPVSKRWDIPFTNFILVSDRPTLFNWIANWKGRILPFDLVATPVASQELPEQTKSTAASTPPPPDQPKPSTASARFAKNAPTVEVPEELSRASRRRPKRKWTHKRVANTLNLGLGALGLVCVGVILYLLYDYKSPTQSVPNLTTELESPVPSANEDLQTTSIDIRDQWNRLAQDNQLLERSDDALRLARQLAEQGDRAPFQIASILSKATQQGSTPVELTIPPSLIRKAEGYWELESILSNELAEQGFVLLPQMLSEQLAILSAQSNPADRVYERLLHDRFLLEEAEIGLKALRRTAKDQLVGKNLESITPAEDYLALWQTLANDNRLEPISKIETAFDINPLSGFFAVDEGGMLLSPERTDITRHLVKLYEQFLLPHFSSFGNAPEFRQALQSANGEFDSAIDAARAIYEVLSNAQPESTTLQKRLQTLREQWREIFIRDDLMKETMINFNFERLAASKLELAQLQKQFDQQTLTDLRTLESVLDTIDTAEQTLAQIDSRAVWTLLKRPPQ